MGAGRPRKYDQPLTGQTSGISVDSWAGPWIQSGLARIINKLVKKEIILLCLTKITFTIYIYICRLYKPGRLSLLLHSPKQLEENRLRKIDEFRMASLKYLMIFITLTQVGEWTSSILSLLAAEIMQQVVW